MRCVGWVGARRLGRGVQRRSPTRLWWFNFHGRGGSTSARWASLRSTPTYRTPTYRTPTYRAHRSSGGWPPEMQIKGGASRLPLQGILLCSSSADGLVVFVGSPVGHRPHSSPIRDIKNKRIILVADVATTLAGSTGSGAASRQFYCSRSGRQETCRAIPLQKNQFATSPTCLFLLCRSRYVLFLLLGVFSCSCYANNKAFVVLALINP